MATLAFVLGSTAIAVAQPANPYDEPPKQTDPTKQPAGPADPYGASGISDPALAEQVAASLVDRAQELLDAKIFADAKQLAVEAIATAPNGPSAAKARVIVKSVNTQLNIHDEPPVIRPPVNPSKPPAEDITPPPPPPHKDTIERPSQGGRMAATVHVASYAALIGTTIGTAFSNTPGDQVAPAIAIGAVAGLGAGVFAAPLLDRRFNEAQIRTMGAGTTWGGVIGGLFAATAIGGNGTDSASARQVLIGASIGATVGGLGGYGLSRSDKLTTGDVALMDTFAGIGTMGGFTMGMLMQPARAEAYDLNAIIGASAGLIVGYIYAPDTNTTPRRMLRVAGVAAAGAAIPFLLYAAIYDPNSSDDERLVGLLSTAGLLGGTYLGFRWTKHLDEGLDVKPGKEPKLDAPPAVVGRNSDGSFSMNGIGIQPLSRRLDNHQAGSTFTLFSGAF